MRLTVAVAVLATAVGVAVGAVRAPRASANPGQQFAALQ